MHIDYELDAITKQKHAIEDIQADLDTELKIYHKKVERLNHQLNMANEALDVHHQSIFDFVENVELDSVNIRIILKHLNFFSSRSEIEDRLLKDNLSLFALPEEFHAVSTIMNVVSVDESVLDNYNFTHNMFEAIHDSKFPLINGSDTASISSPIVHLKGTNYDFIGRDNGDLFKFTFDPLNSSFVFSNKLASSRAKAFS